jgi:hypothetical protein
VVDLCTYYGDGTPNGMTDEKYVISCHFRGRDSTVYSMYHTTVPVARYGLLWQLRTCLDMFVFGSTQDGIIIFDRRKLAPWAATTWIRWGVGVLAQPGVAPSRNLRSRC